ncbi:hypothetical protein [Microcella sp.]|uniref:hypothetical protein n=1 Tax=Microcella sp. TaxID=1913979 RepID=UPI00299F64BF|nr:hypothetical protein [Microcella sp.]MDX2025568.1 hypothetical protein [Microcella sp.]
MIATPVAATDGSPWLLVALLVVLAIGAFGVWMIVYPDDARRFMDHSQQKGAAWFNSREPRPTPRSFPRIFGAVVAAFAAVVAALFLAEILGAF